jgi:hypothetical protein
MNAVQQFTDKQNVTIPKICVLAEASKVNISN